MLRQLGNESIGRNRSCGSTEGNSMRAVFKKKIWTQLILLTCFLGVIAQIVLSMYGDNSKRVLIYSSAEDYRMEHMWQRLEETFPE